MGVGPILQNDDYCMLEVERFMEGNRLLLEHRVVKSFLKSDYHHQLLVEAICSPTLENKQRLDDEFRKFYFDIRFTTYISTTLYFNAINYDKRHRKLNKRYQTTLDNPLGEDQDASIKDLLEDPNSHINEEQVIRSLDIKEHIVDTRLLKAVDQLTKKQKEVIDLAYVNGLSDTEIAKILGKTQQAISKLHKKALERIKAYLFETVD